MYCCVYFVSMRGNCLRVIKSMTIKGSVVFNLILRDFGGKFYLLSTYALEEVYSAGWSANQSTVFFSHIKSTLPTSQLAIFFLQQISISHQPTEQCHIC